jgi:diaminohydroxyphosphoribosylaminopyrimidine deaminase/5-amino-6-(5-phosphoribosylamino)uracil reductase
MVGAVVVKNGKIVGQGYHRRFGLSHAEVNALNDAGTEAKSATLYINLEPCCYFGKTPPCTDAIIQAGIKRVFCALPDPNPRIRGRGFKKLRENGIEVDVGILKHEALKLNEIYLKFTKSKIPFLAIAIVQTINGKVIPFSENSKDLNSEKAKRILKNLKLKFDAVLTQDRLQLSSKLKNIVEKDQNWGKGAKTLISLLKKAKEKNIASILVQGGKENLTYLLKNQLVDRIYFFLCPRISFKGMEPFGNLGVLKVTDSIYLKNREVQKFGDHILITGYPIWR